MAANSQRKGGLDRYRQKRDAGRTPEPFGSSSPGPASGGGPGLFVVQKHAATRLHYDFRLELEGVLESWAVPRGPSLDPADKRMAVHVEPHPIDYGDFEGIIPEGNYGAGAVILWDRGLWVPLEDPVAGLESGKLLFELKGYKLRGVWTLVRTKRPREKQPGNEWLLIKKPDGWADPQHERLPAETSVLSGMTVEELSAGPERADALRAELAALSAPEREVDPRSVEPMLCTPREAPFSGDDWIFELKYDGYRMIAAAADHAPYLRYRSGHDATALYPEIAAAVAALPYADFVVDGEVVVFEDDGRPSFNRLQRRSQLARVTEIKRAAIEHPATLVVFDLLSFEGHDLRDLPLTTRKQLLRELLPATGPLRYADHIERAGELFYRKVQEMGLEGIVGKRADSRYRPIRSDDWLKIRVDYTADFAVVGYSEPKRGRTGLGALHLAVRTPQGWWYAGKVGTGFSDAQLAELREALDALPPFDQTTLLGPPPMPGGTNVWVEPRLVCRVRYKEWRPDGLLRQPAFLERVDDKAASACVHPGNSADREAPPEPEIIAGEPRQVHLTNLDKLFWPAEEGHSRALTKGDLIAYYRDIAPWLLPYLGDRLVVLTRYPDGIYGKSFFQKDAPTWVPDWIRTEVIWSQHAEREIHYFMAEDAESLVFLANLGTIPLHVWSSRMATLERPDWTIIDLDPKGAPFTDVVICARAVRDACKAAELPCYCKTSGQAGLHVLIPLGRQCTYEQSRDLALLIAKLVETQHGDIATTARALRAREGRVYLDCLQNGHGRLLVAPYSVRPVPGAQVSAPLRWREVTPDLDVGRFTIETMLARVRRMKSDPLLPVLDDKPDLARALELLADYARDLGIMGK